jgi:Holliday junction resolvasome RuvABC endonuclease subunit
MIVLGLDPGTRYFGWGVVAKTGTRLSHVAHGVVAAGEELAACPPSDAADALAVAITHLQESSFLPERPSEIRAIANRGHNSIARGVRPSKG